MNPFEEYARTAISRPVQRKMARQAKREKTAKEKAIDERNHLTRQYKKHWKNLERKTIEECSDPAALEAIINLIRRAKLSDGKMLIKLCQDPWLLSQSKDTRFLILHIINEQICRRRQKAGLEEIDDALPYELDPETKPKVFEICRKTLMTPTNSQTGFTNTLLRKNAAGPTTEKHR